MKKLNISLIGLSLFACTSAICADDCTPSGQYKYCCQIMPTSHAFDCTFEGGKNYYPVYKDHDKFGDFTKSWPYNSIICKYKKNSGHKLICKGYGDYNKMINDKVKKTPGGEWAGWHLESGTAILELDKNKQ